MKFLDAQQNNTQHYLWKTIFNIGGNAVHTEIKTKWNYSIKGKAGHNIIKYHKLGGIVDHNIIKYHRLGNIADRIRISKQLL